MILKRLVIALFFLASPIIINWLIGLTSPIEVVIQGKGSDWIAFWGSYMGGTISSFAAFYILYQNRIDARKERGYTNKKERLKDLEKELANHIATLDYHTIFQFISYPNKSTELAKQEIERLNGLSAKIKNIANCFQLRYPEEALSIDGQSYSAKYTSTVQEIHNTLTLATNLLYNYPTLEDYKKIETIEAIQEVPPRHLDKSKLSKDDLKIIKRTRFIECFGNLHDTSIDSLKQSTNEVFELAKIWIAAERNALANHLH